MRVPIRLIALLASAFMAGSATAGEPRFAAPLVAPEVARTCPQYGPGFIEVPGSKTCVRIGGRVSTGYTFASGRAPREVGSGFGTNARVKIDMRTETDYGPLRLVYQLDAGQDRAFRR